MLHTVRPVRAIQETRGSGAPGQPTVCKQKRFLAKPPSTPTKQFWYRHDSPSVTKTLLLLMNCQLWDGFSKFQSPIIGLAHKWNRPVSAGPGLQLDWSDGNREMQPGRLLEHSLVCCYHHDVTGWCWQWLCHSRWLQFPRHIMKCSSVRFTAVE